MLKFYVKLNWSTSETKQLWVSENIYTIVYIVYDLN